MSIIRQYGYSGGYRFPDPSCEPARVTSVHKGRYGIVSDHGEGYAQLKSSCFREGNLPYPTVGDFVAMIFNPSGDSRIIQTLERKTFFARRDPSPGRGEQAVAANFDHVFIMQSMNENFSIPRLERYLALAIQSRAHVSVILTKADLTADPAFYVDQASAVAVDAPIHAVSTYTGEGIETLSAVLHSGETVVFLGSSGVGKSSLVNALAGDDVMHVSAIRGDGKGRHTTTHRQLLMLPSGVMVIDTPGMRELGMWDAGEGITAAFADVEMHLSHCRFSDCTHTHEPGCAVREAIETGLLSPDRWESYRKLMIESDASLRAAQLIEKQKKMKAISKYNHRRKKENW